MRKVRLKKLSWLALGGLLLLVGVKIGTGLLAKPPISEEQRILQRLEEAKKAFEQKERDTLMAMLSEEFRWQDFNRQRLSYQLAQFFRQVKQVRASYSSPLVHVAKERAVVQIQARIEWLDSEWHRLEGAVQIIFRAEEGRTWLFFPTKQWKVYRVYGFETEDSL